MNYKTYFRALNSDIVDAILMATDSGLSVIINDETPLESESDWQQANSNHFGLEKIIFIFLIETSIFLVSPLQSSKHI